MAGDDIKAKQLAEALSVPNLRCLSEPLFEQAAQGLIVCVDTDRMTTIYCK